MENHKELEKILSESLAENSILKKKRSNWSTRGRKLEITHLSHKNKRSPQPIEMSQKLKIITFEHLLRTGGKSRVFEI